MIGSFGKQPWLVPPQIQPALAALKLPTVIFEYVPALTIAVRRSLIALYLFT